MSDAEAREPKLRNDRAAVILAAGQGTRMKSALPKPLHAVGGRAMLDWTLASAAELGCGRVVLVVGAQNGAALKAHVGAGAGIDFALQDPPEGTGHAVRAAEAALADFAGDVAVLYADTPLIRPETIARLFEARAQKGGLVVLGFEAADPTGYGRLVQAPDGTLARIVEERDASAEERAIRICNSGVLVADKAMLFQLLSMVRKENAKQEYYLTDVIGLARSSGFTAHVVLGDEAEVLGVNSRVDLAEAEAAFQARARLAMMEAGVTLIDPATVYFSYDTQVAPDVVIEPNVVFGRGVSVAGGTRINAFSHFVEAKIGPDNSIGPFARFRPGAELGAHVHIGNFVEVKNSKLGDGVKANHLAYLGDGDVGARANLGAGTIFCNYDGFFKYRTTVGEDAFIGSDSALVAPVTIGARAYTAAGSVITRDVAPGALAIGRGRQEEKPGWADEFRAVQSARKAAEKDKP